MSRYVVTMEFYMNADDDNTAIQQAEQIAIDRRRANDDQSRVTSIVEQPFGTMKTRKVK